MAQDDDKYTDPELRAEIKEDIHASDKGGQPGQWSARKAQETAEYKKAMQERGEEPYTTEKSEKSKNQNNLTKWGEEDWQTSDGSGNAKQEDGTERRYLPKKAWENMTEEEKRETEEMKLEGSKNGQQHVSNSDAAKKSRKEATASETNGDKATESANGSNENGTASSTSGTKHKRSAADDNNEDGDDSKATKKAKGDDGEEIITKTDTNGNSQNGVEAQDDEPEDGEGKSQAEKSEEHGQAGSSDRLPKEGQDVHWKVGRNWTEGTVVEILHEEKEVDGIHAKASKEEPRVVLKSAKSGKTAVHKPDAVYF